MTKIFDSTLRDGSHVVKHQFNEQQIEAYCQAVDNAGLYVVIVGHGNGLGASSINIGRSKLTDAEMLTVAKNNLKHTKLGVFMMPGYGTIKDDLEPAFSCGVELVCIASHCTEANIMHQHIEFAKKSGKETYGVLMMQHMISDEELLVQARLIESYGADGIILMDSAGYSLPDKVYKRVAYLKENVGIDIGFHAHNNLGMATANSYMAVKAGATIIDGTVQGFGAGAGNCQLEAICSVLKREGMNVETDPYLLMDASQNIVSKFMEQGQGLGVPIECIVSGLAGVFSAYKIPIMKAAKQYAVDYKDIYMELGRRQIVGGQEDMIIQVASELAHIGNNHKG